MSETLEAFTPQRMAIRAVTHEVLSGLAVFGSVYNARTIGLRRPPMPTVRIFMLRDAWHNHAPTHDLGWFLCTGTLTVQIVIEGHDDPAVSDKLDVLCSLATHALLTDIRWRELVHRVEDVTTDITLDDQGEMRTAIATIEMAVVYQECAVRDFDDDFRNVRLYVDFIDPPADPNTGPPGTPPNVPGGYVGGYPGPDGRIELAAQWDVPVVWDWSAQRGPAGWDFDPVAQRFRTQWPR